MHIILNVIFERIYINIHRLYLQNNHKISPHYIVMIVLNQHSEFCNFLKITEPLSQMPIN